MSVFQRNESFRQFYERYPVVFFILLTNTSLFLLLSLNGGSTNGNTLFNFGAFYGPAIDQGEWHRLIFPIFLHNGFSHFFFNGFSLLLFGPFLENYLGKIKFLSFYLLTGISASLFCYFFSYESLAVGASGSLFGLLGFYLFLIQTNSYVLDFQSRQIAITLLILNLIFTFMVPGISISAHLGGLLSGFILAFIFSGR